MLYHYTDATLYGCGCQCCPTISDVISLCLAVHGTSPGAWIYLMLSRGLVDHACSMFLELGGRPLPAPHEHCCYHESRPLCPLGCDQTTGGLLCICSQSGHCPTCTDMPAWAVTACLGHDYACVSMGLLICHRAWPLTLSPWAVTDHRWLRACSESIIPSGLAIDDCILDIVQECLCVLRV